MTNTSRQRSKAAGRPTDATKGLSSSNGLRSGQAVSSRFDAHDEDSEHLKQATWRTSGVYFTYFSKALPRNFSRI